MKEVYRPIKRVRQACAVCRGRKVRCTGERPSCAVCIRSGHDCSYTDNGAGSHAGEAAAPSMTDYRSYSVSGAEAGDNNEQLAVRVALLERQLNELTKNLKSSSCIDDESPTNSPGKERSYYQGNVQNELLHKSAKPFVDRPPWKTVNSLVDLFFIHCYNQPYLFFHEQTFRRRLDERNVPDQLLYALMSTVLRFGKDPYFQGNEKTAAESYATQSWRLMASRWTGDGGEFDLDSIYAIIFLSLHDFTAGRRQGAWLKLGVVIRIAQDLGFSKEPDKTLSVIMQEERRRLFWTIYLLDRLTVCGFNRPPAISDIDCKVSLPCDEIVFRNGYEDNPGLNLENMYEHKPSSSRPNSFALSITMASTLGRIARYMLTEETDVEPVALWDLKSEFAVTSSRLLMFERHFSQGISFQTVVEHDFTGKGMFDSQLTGHLILSHVLFHLCYCLLNHPLLLRHRLACFPVDQVPSSFLGRAIQTCTEHALALSTFLQEAKAAGCNTSIPYFCYGMGVCGSVHALNLHSVDDSARKESLLYFEIICDCLREMAFSKYANNVLSTLQTLKQDSHFYQWLLTPSTCLSTAIEPSETEVLWRLLNFAALADPEVSTVQNFRDSMSPGQQPTPPNLINQPTLSTDMDASPGAFIEPRNTAATATEPSSYDFLDSFQTSDWDYLGTSGNDLSAIFE